MNQPLPIELLLLHNSYQSAASGEVRNMQRILLPVVLAVSLAALATARPIQPNGLSNWSFDELTLKNGAKFQGLILSEGVEGIRFQSVSRPPGRPTVTLTFFFTKAEIAKVKPLSEADRAILKERLAELDPSGAGERKRMESIELVATDWPGKPGGAKLYESDFFTLKSTGSDELARRSAVRLEQIYTAFARFLPPIVKDGKPTLIMLATDADEYETLLGSLGKTDLLNPAVFDPLNNRVLCGNELADSALNSKPLGCIIHNSLRLSISTRRVCGSSTSNRN